MWSARVLSCASELRMARRTIQKFVMLPRPWSFVFRGKISVFTDPSHSAKVNSDNHVVAYRRLDCWTMTGCLDLK